MKRVVAVVVVVAVAAFIASRLLGRDGAAKRVATGGSSESTAGNTTNVGVAPRAKVDPRTQPVASIAGTVRDDKAHPIAKANVCIALYSDELPPDFLEDGLCMPTDASGAYKFEKLFAAEYSIVAGAPHFIPDTFHPGGDRSKDHLKVSAGENKTGIDLVLRSGGVEVTGIVSDIGGGPIAKARVHGSANMWEGGAASPTTETDASGAYSLWLAKGSASITARAEGYASGTTNTNAPGKADILLTPESSLSGIVINARVVAKASSSTSRSAPRQQSCRSGKRDRSLEPRPAARLPTT